MINLVHIVYDDKFIDDTYEVFNSLNRKDLINRYVFISNNINHSFKYLKKVVSNIDIIREEDFLYYLEEKSINAIMLHGLNLINIIPQIKKHIKIFWFAWGFDIYSFPSDKPFIPLNLYRPLTKKNTESSFVNRLRVLHGKIVSFCKRKKIGKAISRIDYFSGVLPDEYQLMKNNSCFKAKEVVFNYFSTDALSSEDLNQAYCEGNSIQVGNSANPTNNHIDLYEVISKLNLCDTKIYSFLSYSGSQDYIENVKKYGEKLFGNNYIAITDFLPLHEYENIVRKCNNVVMGHERQQAMGNIYTAIWAGCKVYLFETSVTYYCLKQLGFLVFTIEKDLTKQNIQQDLTDKEKLYNRKKMLEYHSEEIHYKSINNILDLIENNIENK